MTISECQFECLFMYLLNWTIDIFDLILFQNGVAIHKELYKCDDHKILILSKISDNKNNFYTDHHGVRNNKKDTISLQMKRDF